MKKVLGLIIGVVAFAAMGLSAQDASFDNLYSNLPQRDAVAAAVPAPIPASVDTAPAPQAQREWLVMVFINGVNDLGILGFASKSINAMEQVGSSDKMAVVVEYDMLGQDGSADRNLQFQRGAKTLYIQKDNDPSKITSLPFYNSPDADMGSAANLVRFAKRGIRRFPAKKVALIVWNHGAGRQGISFDDLSGNHMEVDKLGQALDQVKGELGHKIDLFATDACLMQMASVAYQFRNSAGVVVGSEEVVPGDSFPYAQILGALKAKPGMNAELLGTVMVNAYGAFYPNDATLSALRTSALPGFVQALNAWLAAVRADKAALAGAYSRTVASVVSHFTYEDSKDLVDYINKVDSNPKAGPQVKAAGDALKSYITRSLLVHSVTKPSSGPPYGDPYTVGNGLAIYIPDLRYDSGNYEKMDFAAESDWADFLRGMMEARLAKP
jgi:hypothetical protein